jgi:dihydrofolate reductase
MTTTRSARPAHFGFNTHGNIIPVPHASGVGNVTLIAAMDSECGIGIDNRIPWHVPPDARHFKRLTEYYITIMGRKTYESLPVSEKEGIRLLPNRLNVVLTRDRHYIDNLPRHAQLTVADSLETAIAMSSGQQAFIIGGAEIYKAALDSDLVDDMILTRFEKRASTDTRFPDFDKSKFLSPAYSTHRYLKMRFVYEYWLRRREEEIDQKEQQNAHPKFPYGGPSPSR